MATIMPIYGFDLNDTLIMTPSGKFPPTSARDWKWIPKVKEFILSLLEHDVCEIWIFTNQGWKSDKDLNVATTIAEQVRSDLLHKLKMTHRVKLTIANKYTSEIRKPSPLAWKLFYDKFIIDNPKIVPELKFYCGDDVNRTGADILFAYNANVRFLSHMQIQTKPLENQADVCNLLKQTVDPKKHKDIIDVNASLSYGGGSCKITQQICNEILEWIKISPICLVITTGVQGSGKSELTKQLQTVFNKTFHCSLNVYNEFNFKTSPIEFPAMADQTFLTAKSRKDVCEKFRMHTNIHLRVCVVEFFTSDALSGRNMWLRGIIDKSRYLPDIVHIAARKRREIVMPCELFDKIITARCPSYHFSKKNILNSIITYNSWLGPTFKVLQY